MENNEVEEAEIEEVPVDTGIRVDFDPAPTGPVDVLDEEEAGIRPTTAPEDAEEISEAYEVTAEGAPAVAETPAPETPSEEEAPVAVPPATEEAPAPEAPKVEAEPAKEDPFAKFVKHKSLFRYVSKMRQKMAQGYDYVGTCLDAIIKGTENNSIMITDTDNNTMDVPAWYFTLNKDTLEPEPLDVSKPGYEDYTLLLLVAGESTDIAGYWRDRVSIVDVNAEDLFRNLENAKDYEPLFTSADAFRKSNSNTYLSLFYTRDIPVIWRMADYNKSKMVWVDKDGYTHVQLSVGSGTIVKFRDLIKEPEKFVKYVRTIDSTETPYIVWPCEMAPELPAYKYRNLPAVVLKHDSKGRLIPRREIETMCHEYNRSYEGMDEELKDYCILLSA